MHNLSQYYKQMYDYVLVFIGYNWTAYFGRNMQSLQIVMSGFDCIS